MTHRLIGIRTFAALDSRGTDEQERQREAALRQEFVLLVPSAGRLKASELLLQRHHTTTGCTLEYFLVEVKQHKFDFFGTGELPPCDLKAERDYASDVEAVASECGNVKTRLALAISPGLTHRELNENTEAMIDVRTLRSLHRRRERLITFPTPVGNLDVKLPATPRLLPAGVRCTISARVGNLAPGQALLEELSVRPDQDGEPHAFTLPESMWATRADKLSDEANLRLLGAMDGGSSLAIAAAVKFDWETGRPVEIEVLSV